MPRPSFLLRPSLVLLVGFLVLWLTACAAEATPTPTPAPPTPTPTATPTPTPTPTPLPPTPTPTPTATPTPTPTPSPTPTPTLFDAIAVAEKAMVRLSRGSTRWSGVMIDGKGLILTTGRNLGAAPVADFTTVGGLTGQAWVIGRDDTKDVALLQVINPSQTYPALSLATGIAIQINEELASLSFTDAPTPALDKRNSRVVGVRQDLNTGISYLQVQAVAQAGAEGGIVVDNQGRVRGLRMTETQMVKLGLGRAGEVYVMAADPLSSVIVPQLQTGFTSILPPDSTVTAGTDPGGPPPIPATISGTITVGGQKPTTTIRLYAQVSKAGLPDLWFSVAVRPETQGEYAVAIGITVSGYDGATVRFWTNAKEAPQTGIYTPGAFQSINLVFP